MGRSVFLLVPPAAAALLVVSLPAPRVPAALAPAPPPDAAPAPSRAARALVPPAPAEPPGSARRPVARAAAAAALAAAPAGARARPAAPPLVLRVVFAASGAPAAGAAVEVVHRGRPPALHVADARGEVALDIALEPVRAVAWSGDAVGGPLRLAGTASGATIALVPARRLVGRVLDDATGAPIAGARVRVWTFAELDAATSAADGSFAHPRFPAHEGGAQVRVEADGHGAVVRYVEMDADGAWRVLAAHEDGPRASGDGGPAELVVRLPRELRLAGRVLAPGGAPLAGARVVAEGYARVLPSVASPDRAAAETDEAGRFALAGLRADVGHALRVEAPGLATLEVEVAAGAGGVRALGDLRLAPEALLQVAAIEASGRPAAGVALELVPDRPPAAPPASPVDPGARVEGRRRVLTDEAGNAVLAGLPAGRYELRARCGPSIVARTPVTLATGQLLDGVVLVLETEPGSGF